MDELTKLKAKYESSIKAKKNVIGMGIGYRVKDGKRTDEICLVVLVKEKVPISALAFDDIIPSVIEGVHTDVQVRKAVAMAARTAKWRPAPGGVSVGHLNVTAGTLSFCCFRGQDLVALSNNHVIADSDRARLGDVVLQPGVYDGGTAFDRIGTLLDFEPIMNRTPEMDAAIFKFGRVADASFEILESNYPQSVVEAHLGQICKKSGRTTGLTRAMVSIVDATIDVNFGGKIVTFVHQIIADRIPGESRVIQGGDSGSALLSLDNQLVGLCFAGDFAGSFLVANRIQPVLQRFGLRLAQLPPQPPGTTERRLGIGASFRLTKRCPFHCVLKRFLEILKRLRHPPSFFQDK